MPLAERGDLWAQYKACADDLCDDGAKLLELARAYAKWRTKADLLARPLGPVPAIKRKRAAAALPDAGAREAAPPPPEPPKDEAAEALASQYGSYADYGA